MGAGRSRALNRDQGLTQSTDRDVYLHGDYKKIRDKLSGLKSDILSDEGIDQSFFDDTLRANGIEPTLNPLYFNGFSLAEVNVGRLPHDAQKEVALMMVAAINLNDSFHNVTGQDFMTSLSLFKRTARTRGLHNTSGFNISGTRDIAINSTSLSTDVTRGLVSSYSASILFGVNGGYAAGVVTHESGHVFEQYLSTSAHSGRYNAFKNAVFNMEPVTQSGYRNHKEAFAEASAMYFAGVKTPSHGAPYYKEFTKMMKDTGFSSMFGAILNNL